MRALASHQCGLGSIPRFGVICDLSLLVLFSAPRGFSPGVLRFSPLVLNRSILRYDLICMGTSHRKLVSSTPTKERFFLRACQCNNTHGHEGETRGVYVYMKEVVGSIPAKEHSDFFRVSPRHYRNHESWPASHQSPTANCLSIRSSNRKVVGSTPAKEHSDFFPNIPETPSKSWIMAWLPRVSYS